MKTMQKSGFGLHLKTLIGRWTGHNNTETTVIQSASGPQTRILQDKTSITANGQTKDRLELNSLADWGITAIDYANNRYEFDSGLRNTGVANGQISYQNIKTVSLEASNQGVSYTPIGAGIRIDDSTGSSTILITQIQSDGGSLPPVNTLPQIDKAIADRTMNEDDVLVWEVPSDAFKDINTNDRLNYTVVQANGQALPAWMAFNAVSGQLIAEPGNAQVGTISLRVIATDRSGAAASDVFEITVRNVNDAPVVTGNVGQPSATLNSIAACAIDTPARGLNNAENRRIAWELREITNHYEFNSGLRRFYAGYLPKTLVKQPGNDSIWRLAS